MLRFVCISESCAPFQSLYAPFGETFALKVLCSTSGVFTLPVESLLHSGAILGLKPTGVIVLHFWSLYAPRGESFALKVRCWGLDPLMLQYRDAFWDPAPLTLQFCDASGGRAQLNLLLSGIRTLRFNLGNLTL